MEDSVESRRGGSAPLPPLLPAAVVATPGAGNSDEFLAEAREKKQEAEVECSGKSCHPSLTANLLLYACRDTQHFSCAWGTPIVGKEEMLPRKRFSFAGSIHSRTRRGRRQNMMPFLAANTG